MAAPCTPAGRGRECLAVAARTGTTAEQRLLTALILTGTRTRLTRPRRRQAPGAHIRNPGRRIRARGGSLRQASEVFRPPCTALRLGRLRPEHLATTRKTPPPRMRLPRVRSCCAPMTVGTTLSVPAAAAAASWAQPANESRSWPGRSTCGLLWGRWEGQEPRAPHARRRARPSPSAVSKAADASPSAQTGPLSWTLRTPRLTPLRARKIADSAGPEEGCSATPRPPKTTQSRHPAACRLPAAGRGALPRSFALLESKPRCGWRHRSTPPAHSHPPVGAARPLSGARGQSRLLCPQRQSPERQPTQRASWRSREGPRTCSTTDHRRSRAEHSGELARRLRQRRLLRQRQQQQQRRPQPTPPPAPVRFRNFKAARVVWPDHRPLPPG